MDNFVTICVALFFCEDSVKHLLRFMVVIRIQIAYIIMPLLLPMMYIHRYLFTFSIIKLILDVRNSKNYKSQIALPALRRRASNLEDATVQGIFSH